jgi:hypothetical protein
MSAVPDEEETASTRDNPLQNLLFDYAGGADIILCSQDGCQFRVPKTSIINNSPTLGELIQKALDSHGDLHPEALLPVVQLPESGEILHCLLTFIFPVIPFLPLSPEEVMQLLSVAQKYQMETALAHIRGSIARQDSLPTRIEPALHIYALSQKYGLRPEALQTARTILNHGITSEAFEKIPGAALYEFWKYNGRVRAILASSLTEFRMSSARGTLTGLLCTELSSSEIPIWLDRYTEAIGNHAEIFDYAVFSMVLARHIKDKAKELGCQCMTIPTQTIRSFWEALESVVHHSSEEVIVCRTTDLLRMLDLLQAESALSLVRDQEDPQAQINWTPSPPETFDAT